MTTIDPPADAEPIIVEARFAGGPIIVDRRIFLDDTPVVHLQIPGANALPLFAHEARALAAALGGLASVFDVAIGNGIRGLVFAPDLIQRAAAGDSDALAEDVQLEDGSTVPLAQLTEHDLRVMDAWMRFCVEVSEIRANEVDAELRRRRPLRALPSEPPLTPPAA